MGSTKSAGGVGSKLSYADSTIRHSDQPLRGYLLGQHSPAEFLSIGEVRTLLVSKYDTTFSNPLRSNKASRGSRTGDRVGKELTHNAVLL